MHLLRRQPAYAVFSRQKVPLLWGVRHAAAAGALPAQVVLD